MDWGTIIQAGATLAGAFGGAYFGFTLAARHERKVRLEEANRRRQALLIDLQHELNLNLKYVMERLQSMRESRQQTLQRMAMIILQRKPDTDFTRELLTDVKDSSVSSGDFRLLPATLNAQLSQVYAAISQARSRSRELRTKALNPDLPGALDDLEGLLSDYTERLKLLESDIKGGLQSIGNLSSWSDIP